MGFVVVVGIFLEMFCFFFFYFFHGLGSSLSLSASFYKCVSGKSHVRASQGRSPISSSHASSGLLSRGAFIFEGFFKLL